MKKILLVVLMIVLSTFSAAQIINPGGGGSGPTLITTGLLADYQMLETSGTTLADSASGNTATCGTAPNFIGAPTFGLNFTGTQQCLVPLGVSTTTASYELIVAYSTNSVNAAFYDAPILACVNNAGACATGLGTGITIQDTGAVGFQTQNPPHKYAVSTWDKASGNRATGTGQFLGTGIITVVYDSTVGHDRIYINGIEDGYIQSPGLSAAPTGLFMIGGGAVNFGISSDNRFHGNIFRIRLFSSVLTPLQVLQDAQALTTTMSTTRALPTLLQNGQGVAASVSQPLITAATASMSGSTATFTGSVGQYNSGSFGITAGMAVTVTGCTGVTAYNGAWTVATYNGTNIITATSATQTGLGAGTNCSVNNPLYAQGNNSLQDMLLATGDSITAIGYPKFVGSILTGMGNTQTNNFLITNTARDAWKLCDNIAPYAWMDTDPSIGFNSGKNTIAFMAGTNDLTLNSNACGGTTCSAAQTYSCYTSFVRARSQKGWKVVSTTPLDRSGFSAIENAYGLLIRNGWQAIGAVALADQNGDPNLGCTTPCNTNLAWFSDGIHPTVLAESAIMSPILAKAINYAFGNLDWSQANSYGNTTAPSASITACTGTLIASMAQATYSLPSTTGLYIGADVLITGSTVGLYNTSAINHCIVQTITTNTSFACTLGVATSTLPASACTATFPSFQLPQFKDQDVYTILTGTTSGPMTSCDGATGQRRYYWNQNGGTNTMTAWGPEKVNTGGTAASTWTIASGHVGIVRAQTIFSTGVPTCSWVVEQQ